MAKSTRSFHLLFKCHVFSIERRFSENWSSQHKIVPSKFGRKYNEQRYLFSQFDRRESRTRSWSKCTIINLFPSLFSFDFAEGPQWVSILSQSQNKIGIASNSQNIYWHFAKVLKFKVYSAEFFELFLKNPTHFTLASLEENKYWFLFQNS